MIYIKEIPTQRLEDALVISEKRVEEIKQLIGSAYNQSWHKDGPNIDQINAFIAPAIRTPEEAFYAATVILTDVFGAYSEVSKPKRK